MLWLLTNYRPLRSFVVFICILHVAISLHASNKNSARLRLVNTTTNSSNTWLTNLLLAQTSTKGWKKHCEPTQQWMDCRTYYEDTKLWVLDDDEYDPAEQWQFVLPAYNWCKAGSYFKYKSAGNNLKEVNIFHLCKGSPTANKKILVVHGWPTSSYDFEEVINKTLEATKQNGNGNSDDDTYQFCLLDMPGYGFSEKPRHNYTYSLFDDAQLFDFYVRNILKWKEFNLYSHDRGDSVALQFLNLYFSNYPPYSIHHHFISNGNIYLPLSNLTLFQNLTIKYQFWINPNDFAHGVGDKLYTPELKHSAKDALGSIFKFQNGTCVLHATIQYLLERKRFEDMWLQVLAASNIDATIFWGTLDQVSTVAVMNFVYENVLSKRQYATANKYYVNNANHYVQHDKPLDVANILMSNS